MTTPDKEEMPTDRTAGPLATSLSQMIIEWVDSARGRDWRGGLTNIIQRRLDRFQSPSCNAYEPMREALILAEKADRIHSKCQECEDGAQAPEACGDCFPSADDARVARRNVLKSLGVRMRDVDRARAIEAEPSICNCSQEDVHDYGPCGEDCRSLVVSTLPVNDRHHSGSDNYQADAGAPALSEKVNDRSEWLPIESAPRDGTHILAFGPQPGCNAREHGWTEVRETHFEHSGWDWYEAVHNRSHKWKPTHWMPLPSPPGAEVTISNEPERDAVRLKPDTSSQPASEAGKLSSEAQS